MAVDILLHHGDCGMLAPADRVIDVYVSYIHDEAELLDLIPSL